MHRPSRLETALILPVALSTILGSVACVTRKASSCTSPRVESPRYPAAPNATGDPKTWSGIEVKNPNIPSDANAIASFRRLGKANPDVVTSPWVPSKLIGRKDAEQILLLIGNGPVQFSIEYVSREGSPTCTTIPSAEFPTTSRPRNELSGFAPHWS